MTGKERGRIGTKKTPHLKGNREEQAAHDEIQIVALHQGGD